MALRSEKTREEPDAEEPQQYQLFETSQYKYRVFVTDMAKPIDLVTWFYNQRGGAENLIKEANNDAGLTAHPSHRFNGNSNPFQLAMLPYNLNCWLMPQEDATALQHTTLATSRLRFLFVAAKNWRPAGRTGTTRRRAHGPAAKDCAAGSRLCAGNAARPERTATPPALLSLCIETYARLGGIGVSAAEVKLQQSN